MKKMENSKEKKLSNFTEVWYMFSIKQLLTIYIKKFFVVKGGTRSCSAKNIANYSCLHKDTLCRY